jgi:hypothetical protein
MNFSVEKTKNLSSTKKKLGVAKEFLPKKNLLQKKKRSKGIFAEKTISLLQKTIRSGAKKIFISNFSLFARLKVSNSCEYS